MGPRWLLVVAAVAALVALAAHAGDAGEWVALLRRAEPGWLGVAVAFQLADLALRGLVLHGVVGGDYPRLVRLVVVALYTSAAVPSAGLAGVWLTVTTLEAWGAPRSLAVSAVWVDLLGHYAAYAALVALVVALLGVPPEVLVLGGVLVAGALAIGLFASRTRALPPPDPAIVRDPRQLARAAVLRAGNFAVDVGALWACLAAMGVRAGPDAALCALGAGALARTVGVVPSGLGTFEAAATATFAAFGVPVQEALGAAVLFRGVSSAVQLAPGLWWSRTLLA